MLFNIQEWLSFVSENKWPEFYQYLLNLLQLAKLVMKFSWYFVSSSGLCAEIETTNVKTLSSTLICSPTDKVIYTE